jgi:DNA-binding MarR family transcriptional regulator
VTPQTMNTIINNLEQKKLVVRTVHPLHAHVLEMRLTARGRS